MAAKKKIGKVIRQRTAREDGSIGSLQKTLEKDFKLPHGSVKLVYPSGRKARIDADVGALRKHWRTKG